MIYVTIVAFCMGFLAGSSAFVRVGGRAATLLLLSAIGLGFLLPQSEVNPTVSLPMIGDILAIPYILFTVMLGAIIAGSQR